jgi:hypothetical protein
VSRLFPAGVSASIPRLQRARVQPTRSREVRGAAMEPCESQGRKNMSNSHLQRDMPPHQERLLARPLPNSKARNEFGSQAAPVTDSASPAQHRPCAAPPAPVSFFHS